MFACDLLTPRVFALSLTLHFICTDYGRDAKKSGARKSRINNFQDTTDTGPVLGLCPPTLDANVCVLFAIHLGAIACGIKPVVRGSS